MRTNGVLVIEAAQSWQRLQQANEFFFEDLDQQMKEHHRQFLDALMSYERQRFLNAQPYQRTEQRVDQANGFYGRQLTTRLGVVDLRVPRTRSGCFHSQVLPRYQRREPVINEALKQVFLLGVSTRQAGRALATLVEEAVSASTVSAVAKVLDESVHTFHRRRLADVYRYLVLDGVSVRLRLVGAVQRRMVLCAYGITVEGQRELIDFQVVKGESEDTWYGFLWGLWSRGLRGEHLELIVTDGHAGLARALGRVWSAVAHQRCWAHKLRNLENKLKVSQQECLEEAKLIYQAAHRTEAVQRFRAWKQRWQGRAPRAVACLAADLEELLAFFDCPTAHWKRVRTTNVIERLFVEVRRRIRTMCAFTTRSSCERILYSVFNRMNTYWSQKPSKLLHNTLDATQPKLDSSSAHMVSVGGPAGTFTDLFCPVPGAVSLHACSFCACVVAPPLRRGWRRQNKSEWDCLSVESDTNRIRSVPEGRRPILLSESKAQRHADFSYTLNRVTKK